MAMAMAMPWVILGRVLRGVPGPNDAPAPAADFAFPIALPPRVNVLAAGRDAHPEPSSPDEYPYIVAATPFCLLAHFAAAPFYGAQLDDRPHVSHLVLVRHFHTAEGQTTATAESLTDRNGPDAILENVGNVVLTSDHKGGYTIAELQVHKGSDEAVVVHLDSDGDEWSVMYVRYPLAEVDRKWVPHGGVHADGRLWWFDLSWGILSYDDVDEADEEPGLLFHGLPDGRALDEATPDIHTRRWVTVSRNKLLFVEIVVPEAEAGGEAAATVNMWTRTIGRHGWEWDMNYAVSFENIWNDDSYRETGLPLNVVPVLALVCPSDPELVYFALEQRLFGVNVSSHRVEHYEAYELVDIPGPPHPASGRFVIAWDLPPAVALALGMDHPFAGLIDDEEQKAGEIEGEEEPEVDLYCNEQLGEEFSYAEPQAAVVYEGLQIGEINYSEQPVDETDHPAAEQENQGEKQTEVDLECNEQPHAAVVYERLQIGEINNSKLPVYEISDEEEANRGLAVEMDQATLSRLKAEVKKFAEDHQASVEETSSASATLTDSVGSTAEDASATSSPGVSTRAKRLLKPNPKYRGPDWVSE